MRRPRGLSNIGSLCSTRQPEVNFSSLDFEQTFGQIVSLRVKTLSHTNMVASRYIKKGKAHFRLTCVAQKRCCLNSLINIPVS